MFLDVYFSFYGSRLLHVCGRVDGGGVVWSGIGGLGPPNNYCSPLSMRRVKWGKKTYFVTPFKGIVSDTSNIFLWHESEDINKKKASKISVDSSFMFSSYAWVCVFHCPHRLLCWIKSRVRDFLWKLLLFHTEMISSAWFLRGIVLLRGELWKYAKNSSFDNFESALYSTSVSMPLNSLPSIAPPKIIELFWIMLWYISMLWLYNWENKDNHTLIYNTFWRWSTVNMVNRISQTCRPN